MRSDLPGTPDSAKVMYETLGGMIEHAVLVIDGRQVVVHANRAAQTLFGASVAASLIGTGIDRWLPAFAMGNRTGFAGEAPIGSSWRVQVARRMDGSSDCVSVQRAPVTVDAKAGEMLVLRAHGELQRLRARLKTKVALMKMTATPCMIHGPDLAIQTVNPAFEHIFGYKAHEVVGKRPRDLLTGELTNLAKMQTAFETVLMGGSIKRDEALYRKDGSLVWISYEQHAVRDDLGEVSHIVTTGMDISERRRAEQMKSDFVAMVGHELRTPLTVVSGSLDILGDRRFVNLPPEIGQIVAGARGSCAALKTLIDDLLDINQIEAGLVKLNMSAVNTADCVELALTGVREQAGRRRVTLHPGQGEHVLQATADKARLCQVLTNLLGNAIKYGREGGSVWTSYRVVDHRVVIEVRDDGPGIDADLRSRLFDKFSRAPYVAAQGIDGFGLGLSICRGLVEQMGGEIVLVSAAGEGAAFRVSLPRAIVCAAAVAP